MGPNAVLGRRFSGCCDVRTRRNGNGSGASGNDWQVTYIKSWVSHHGSNTTLAVSEWALLTAPFAPCDSNDQWFFTSSELPFRPDWQSKDCKKEPKLLIRSRDRSWIEIEVWHLSAVSGLPIQIKRQYRDSKRSLSLATWGRERETWGPRNILLTLRGFRIAALSSEPNLIDFLYWKSYWDGVSFLVFRMWFLYWIISLQV